MGTVDVANPVLDAGRLRPLRPPVCAKCDGRCLHQARAFGQYAAVTLAIAPVPNQDGLSLVDKCQPVDQAGSSYHDDGIEYFRRGTARGIADVLEHYRGLGFEFTGLRVTIEQMVVHPIDSNEGAFRVAARNAFASCLLSAGLGR
jgi:translation elongation factor EF-G